MKRAIAASIVVLVLLVAVGFFVARAEAETVKWKLVGYITKMDMVPVPDVENHFSGWVEGRGVVTYENGETAAIHPSYTLDSIIGQGSSFKGYDTISFADGSTMLAKFEGTSTGEKLPSFKATGEWVKGTGRFEGIKGTFTFTGKYITPYTKDETKGDYIMEGTGEYTLPKK
jgi:hypothetical protein